MDKLKKAAHWVRENRYELTIGAVNTAIVGLVGWITYAAYKEQSAQVDAYNKAVEEYQLEENRKDAKIVEEFNSGNLVFALQNGTYLSVPKETNPKLVTW